MNDDFIIEKVRLVCEVDENPDLSLLGSYHHRIPADAPWWSIFDRKLSEDWSDGSREPRWYVGPYENYKGVRETAARGYCRQDYESMEAFRRGAWWFLGIRAEAVVRPRGKNSVCQTFYSPGVWGVQSDSDKLTLDDLADWELADLASILQSFGVDCPSKPAQIREADYFDDSCC